METKERTETGINLSAIERLKTAAINMKENPQARIAEKMQDKPVSGTANTETVKQLIEEWPTIAKIAAQRNIEEYGAPNEALSSRLIWYNNGIWKRTVVYRDEVIHNFPDPHTDVIENVIDYEVPADKMNELAKFDGSITVFRTPGEVSSRGDLEANNMIALNLMHEIVQGKTSAEQAREKYSEQTAAYVMNRQAPYAEKLHFSVSQKNTASPDEVTMADDALKQMKEKVKDLL